MSQLRDNRRKKFAPQYLTFIKALFGKLPQFERMDNVLKMEQPCSYKSFEGLYLKATGSKRKLLDVVMAMDNKKDLTKKYVSLSKTAHNWLDR